VVAQLQSLGYAVTPVADGPAALAACQAAERPFDLLLTDVVMAGINGKALADQVALRWPRTAILFMSGYSRDTIVHDGRLDPGARLVAKPFRKVDLAVAVRNALDGVST
jgi:CheY-like chemotaxis protein